MRKKQILTVTPKKRKRGRPATGRDPLLTCRVPQDIIDAIEASAAALGITRSAAIRQLLERGLAAAAKRRGTK